MAGRVGPCMFTLGVDGSLLYRFTTSTGGYHHVGWTVANAGDANADGYDDILFRRPRRGPKRVR